LFQAFNLVPSLTPEQSITLPLRLARRGLGRAWFGEVAEWPGIADRLGHRPGQLSGGQHQRVAIARALITRLAVVFADEPTGRRSAHVSGHSGRRPGGFLVGHLRLSSLLCAVVLRRLGGDADDLADGFGLAQHSEHVVGEIGAGDGPAAADVVPGRGAVVLGGRLAGEPWRPQDGPVQAGVAQQVFHRGEGVVDLAEQRLGGPHADMPHDEPVAGIVARRIRPAG